MAGDEEWDDFLDDVVSNNEGEEQQRDRVIERQAKKSRLTRQLFGWAGARRRSPRNDERRNPRHATYRTNAS